ncbi:hypothetical protein [Streptomyces sp. NPDC003023]|uniref:hypothetical protein n=1 Tax=Streptomyces sp. NPDC003023 TaxID=3364675 RepID=UPI0036AF097A
MAGQMREQRLEMRQKPDQGTDRQQGGEQARLSRPRLDLSLPQVAGSALAAVAAAVLASRLGVYGTIIGAGVVSLVATCGGSLLQHFFSRTGEQLRGAAAHGGTRAGARQGGESDLDFDLGFDGDLDGDFGAATVHGTRVRGWKRPALAAAAVFGLAMATVTGYELASGGELGGGAGTTLGSAVRGGDTHTAAPSGTPSSRTSDEGADSTGESGPEPAGTEGSGTDSGQSATPDTAGTPSPSPSTGADQEPAPTPTPSPTPTADRPTPSGTGETGDRSGEGEPHTGAEDVRGTARP